MEESNSHCTFHSEELIDRIFGNRFVQYCGRKNERLILMNAYHSLVKHCINGSLIPTTTAVVHGPSGVGKSRFVGELRDEVVSSGGYFVTGKFYQRFQEVAQEPHSAIIAAFSDLCDLLDQSEDFNEEKRMEVQALLGSDADFLLGAIGGLSQLLRCESKFEACDYNNAVAFWRFKSACRRFLRAILSQIQPIVLFIDDIQWMDDESRQLIEMIISDTKLSKLMLVLSYREEESNKISQFLKDTKEVISIHLRNLDQPSVSEMVSNILDEEVPKNVALNNLIFSRTQGNPFHVLQFMNMIQKEELIHYNENDFRWEYCVDTIQKEIAISETLAQLLSRRILHLEWKLQLLLSIASLIGYSFNQGILIPVASAELKRRLSKECICLSSLTLIVHTLLAQATKEGYLERNRDGFNFTHDRIQMSFQDLLDYDEKERFHYFIGKQVLLCDDVDDVLYLAAFQLNCGKNFTLTRESCDWLARLNLDAALRALGTSAFEKAATFLRYGRGVLIDDLKEDRWKSHFALTLDLTENLAKAELINGNQEACKRLNKEVLSNCFSVDKMLRTLILEVEVRMLQNDVEDSIATALNCLKLLGISFPRNVTVLNLGMKLMKVRRSLCGQPEEAISQLKPIQDPCISTALKILVDLCSYCLLNEHEILGVFSALIATDLTLSYGLSPYASNCFTIYGVIEIGMGKIQRGIMFADAAFRLMHSIKCKEAECLTRSMTLTLIYHWRTPIRDMCPMFLEALNTAQDVGDVMYGSLCIAHCFAARYILGENLEVLENQVLSIWDRVKDLGQHSMIRWSQPCLQFILNMRSTSHDWMKLTVLTGYVMNEDEFIHELEASNHKTLLTILLSFKAFLAYHFGYFCMAEALFDKMKCRIRIFENSYAGPLHFLYGAMISYERYRTSKRMKHLKAARMYYKKIKRFEKAGSPNVYEALLMLEAEEMSTKSRNISSTIEAYLRAIDAVKQAKLVHFEAMLYERLSSEWLVRRDYDQSLFYVEQALDLYLNSWGALAKYELLSRQISLRPSRVGNEGYSLTPIDEVSFQVSQ